MVGILAQGTLKELEMREAKYIYDLSTPVPHQRHGGLSEPGAKKPVNSTHPPSQHLFPNKKRKSSSIISLCYNQTKHC
jgi:hypothetical protein